MRRAVCLALPVALVMAAGTTPAVSSELGAKLGFELEGLVSDERGQPLGGALVSVFGKNLDGGALTAVTDEQGRFLLEGVPPGLYQLRAYLAGFLPSEYARVVLEEGMERMSAILMSLATLDSSGAASIDSVKSRSTAELKWILRHGERNVLNDSGEIPVVAIAEASRAAALGRFHRSSELTQVSGEFGVRTAAFDPGLEQFPGAGAGLDAHLAYARLSIPSTSGARWLVSAQLLESALSSWAGRAEYRTGGIAGHDLAAGVSYGNFLYGDLQGFKPPEAALTQRDQGVGSMEWFGSVYAHDAFAIGAASVRAGFTYDYFGYLDQSGYASPELELAYPVGAGSQTVLRGGVFYRVEAPGGEDIGLLSRLAYSDVFGPSPEGSDLKAQRTASFQVAVEQRLSEGARLVVRAFQQDTSDQLLKVYSAGPTEASAGHFSIANLGDFRTRGLGITLSQRFGPTVGSMSYTFGNAEGFPSQAAPATQGARGEIHDVTTTVATSIEKTRTRVQAAYRVIRHPEIAAGHDGMSTESSLDSRFNIQVYQFLPFVGWNGTRWELMVAVRNLFYENLEDVSILDEIAVVDSPRRVLGGVTVRF